MKSAQAPLVSVIIPTLGKSPHLRGLLERLQRQKTEFNFEVLVVANIPRQQLRKLVNSMGTVVHSSNAHFEYLETGRLGVNIARNRGLERAQAPIVLFFDDDAILEDDTIVSKHFERHQTHPEAIAVGGPYQLANIPSLWDEAYHATAHEWLMRHTMASSRATQLLGGNLSMKRNELQKNGWRFDEAISFGGAETGLCTRMVHGGKTLLFFADLAIGHAPNLNRRTFCRKAYLQGAGARWRAHALPSLDRQFVNEFLPATTAQDFKLRRAKRLYHRFFKFGCWSNPYGDDRKQKSRLIRSTGFSYSGFLIFEIFNLRPLQSVRIFHRRLYAMLRSAWLNRQVTPPIVRPVEKQ